MSSNGPPHHLACITFHQSTGAQRPPIVFVHGSYHGAWCWKENYQPYFASKGYSGYSISLRAQGNSDLVDAPVAGTLAEHASDLAHFIQTLPHPPVVVGHSFGGIILQKYLLQDTPPLAGAAFLCSVPPSGNKEMVGRFMRRDPVLAFKLTWGFITKSFARSLDACQELFFSADLPRDKLQRYQQALAGCSSVRLVDLQDMNKIVPLPPPKKDHPPVFVMGGLDDKVVDMEGVRELAQYFGVQAVLLPKTAHDCMLDTRWQESAEQLDTWLDSIPSSRQ